MNSIGESNCPDSIRAFDIISSQTGIVLGDMGVTGASGVSRSR